MAVCFSDGHGRNSDVLESDLPTWWQKEEIGGLTYYVFERTDENGKPFKTSLY